MRSFEELKFEEPYPIFKSYVVPYRDDAGIIDYRRVKSEDVETYKDVLKKLREFLQSILGIEIVKSYDEVRKLELIGDLISLYFKIPLLKELFPSAILSPLKIYMLCRVHLVPTSHKGKKPSKELKELLFKTPPADFIEGIYKGKEKYSSIIERLTTILADEKLCKDIEKSWFIFPSDTRPGFNTSGLIPHHLLTSAIAWSLATINKKLDRTEIAVLRLASLLHDIGKPFNYKQHIELSTNVARLLLDGLIPEQTLSRIVDIISKHHEPKDDLSAILKEADTMASTIDRVRQLVESYLKEDLESIAKELDLNYEDGLKTGDVAWDFWIKVNEKRGSKIFEDLNSKFLNSLRKETDGFKSPVKPFRGVEGERREEEDYRNVLIGVIDVAGIQKYISRSQEIKVTSGASLLIDYLVMAYAPFYIQSNMDEYDIWVPYESFIYTAGGVVEFVMPRLFVNEFEKIVGDQLNNILSNNGLKVTFAYTQFRDNMYLMIKELINNLHLKKNSMEGESMPIARIKSPSGYEDLCQLCYLDDVETKIETPEGLKRVCNVCKSLYEFGGEISFKNKYEATIFVGGKPVTVKDVYDLDWEHVNKYIIELISGHDKPELRELIERRTAGVKLRNIAVLKVDGNLMGPFMATSISPTDMYERSARIDMALKNAIMKALTVIYESIMKYHGDLNEALKPYVSTLFGTLYVGGDDALIIMPSWTSIVFSWIVGNEFRLNMGKSRGLSIGIAVGSAKANIWGLISAANSLMKEGKKNVRDDPGCSVVAFDVEEAITLNDSIVRERIQLLRDKMISIQPFKISENDGLKDYIKLLFESSDYADFIWKSYLASRYVDYITKHELKPKIEEFQSFIKGIRSGILECMNRADSFIVFSGVCEKDADIFKLFIEKVYAKRQYARFKEMYEKTKRKNYEDNMKIYNTIFELCPKEELSKFLGKEEIPHTFNASISDAYRMIKIVGGGVI